MTRAVRPALLAMRDPGAEAGPNANLGFFAAFRDARGNPIDPSDDTARDAFRSAYLSALDAEPGEPKLPYGEALIDKGFVDANFKNALLEAARTADWPVSGKEDEQAPEARRPQTLFLPALLGEKDQSDRAIVSAAFDRALDGLAGDLRERFEGEFRDPGSTGNFTGGPFMPQASSAPPPAPTARPPPRPGRR